MDEASGAVQLDVHGGESVALNGNNPTQYNLAESIEPDSWDAWNNDRDQALSAEASAQTPATQEMPNSNNPAWGDLNQNGTWYNTPDQGYVWSPYEASDSGWDPYGMGYWMDQPGYGYMWVSGEPWGYMPYQCGAWNYYNSFGWGWSPGTGQPWGGGGGGWGYNIGRAPTWYHRPERPGPPRPRNPHPVERAGGTIGKPPIGLRPVIAVNRHLVPPANGVLPPREKGTPVMLGGTLAEPLRPVSTRARYGGLTIITDQPRGVAPVSPAGRRPVYTAAPGQNTFRPSEPAPRNVYTPPAPRNPYMPSVNTWHPAPVAPRAPSGDEYHPPSGGSRRSAPAPRSAPSAHSSPAPSHSSGGGSRGGGAHK
jgi:hypothetical protein